VLVINAQLTAKGCNPIPFDETTFTEVMTYVLEGLGIVWVWFKDSPITKRARDMRKRFEEIEREERTTGQI